MDDNFIIKCFLRAHKEYIGRNGYKYFFVTLGTKNKKNLKRSQIRAVLNSWNQLNLFYIIVRVRGRKGTHYHAAVFAKKDILLFAPQKYFKNNYWHEVFNAYSTVDMTQGSYAVCETWDFQVEATKPVRYILEQKGAVRRGSRISAYLSPRLKKILEISEDEFLQ